MSESPTPHSRRHSSLNMKTSPSNRTNTSVPTRSCSLRHSKTRELSETENDALTHQQIKLLKERRISRKRYSLPVGKRDTKLNDQQSKSAPNTLLRTPSRRNSPLKPLITDVNNIKVITRFRPANPYEEDKGHTSIIKDINDTSVTLKDSTFTYDRMFGPKSTQCDVFNYSVLQTVDDFFNGYNGTVLTYGQTGSGKTFTMMGDLQNEDMKGLIPRIADAIFNNISTGSSNTEFTLSASYMEIYMELIRDLLSSSNKETLQVVEDKVNGVHVTNLTKAYISSTEELHALLKRGSELRVTSSTEMNRESSRSHAIFQLNLTQESPEFGIRRSKLFLVDLAGSEKVSKTGVSGLNLEEAKKINSSLSSLGNVINALTDSKSTHIPYRDSKLTRILQESLGGNSRTSLIINCSPSSYNEFETLSTLRFGTRAKKIKNKAHVNIEPSSQDLLKQIEVLKRMNEDNVLRNKELECELDLWRSGVNRLESSEDERSMKDTQNDFDETTTAIEDDCSNQEIEVKLKEAKTKINMLTDQISVYKDILSKVPDQMDDTSDDIYEQLKESQIINGSLMLDVTNKCEKLIEMEMQIDSLEQELHKAPGQKLQHEKFIALEKTIEHLNIKMDELELQNNLLRKDLKSTKNISETRNERIRTLEQLVQDQQSQIPKIPQKQSKSISKFSFLRNSLYQSSNLSNEKLLSSDQYLPSSSSFDGVLDSFSTNSSRKSAASNYDTRRQGGDQLGDMTYHNNDAYRRQNRRGSTTSSNSSTSNNVLSGGRVGFNLHIVKPMRGGGSSQAE